MDVLWSDLSMVFHWLYSLSLIVLIHLLCLTYGILRIFQLACYTRITIEWLPFINPYTFPFWIAFSMTDPYISAFTSSFPTLNITTGIFEISILAALELINLLLAGCHSLLWLCISVLENEWFMDGFLS